jgi:5-methylcytosine-specific restriction endonuclease McrA
VAALNERLKELVDKDKEIQAACMPLRQRMADINSRIRRIADQHKRTVLGFLGFAPGKDFDDRLDEPRAELQKLCEQVRAIAEKPLSWKLTPQLEGRGPRNPAGGHYVTVDTCVCLGMRLITPHALEIEAITNAIKRESVNRPTLQEDAAWRRDQEEQQRKAARQAQLLATKADRDAAKADREAAKKRKADALRAAVASALGKSRDHADNVKRKLRKDHDCPYCGGPLGSQPHADHIYPVSKGGRSMAANMVFVCAECNVKKGDMTLAAFIAFCRLDRDTIEARLKDLDKEY